MGEFQPIGPDDGDRRAYVTVDPNGAFYISPPLFQSHFHPSRAVRVHVDAEDGRVALEPASPDADDPSVARVSVNEVGGGLFRSMRAPRQAGWEMEDRAELSENWDSDRGLLVLILDD